jgi:phosphatidylserine/phosphatidylglycerophosphate/cardiolipin synthase-like enzyme
MSWRLGVVASCAAALIAPGTAARASMSPGGSLPPHLEQVMQALRNVSPGLEIGPGAWKPGQTWQATVGNQLGASANDWILPVPGCWGKQACGKGHQPGVDRLLKKMTDNISKATTSVDISTLAGDGSVLKPWYGGPDFIKAIARGLKIAAANLPNGKRLKFRYLLGAVPGLRINHPSDCIKAIKNAIGDNTLAGRIDFNVASMDSYYQPLRYYRLSSFRISWNHSKLVVVDRKTAITGGINYFQSQYIDTTSPVTDIAIALTGPAAASAGRYLDTLWSWGCGHIRGYVALGTSPSSVGCMKTLPGPASQTEASAGGVPVISVGDLGLGIMSKDEKSTYQLPPAKDVGKAFCTAGSVPFRHYIDHTNADRDYATVNPGEVAQRALIQSAQHSIDISQQDVLGNCFGDSTLSNFMPHFDVRTLDALVARMIHGVKVRIVYTTPGQGDYSNLGSSEKAYVADTLRARLMLQLNNDRNKAKEVMDNTLQLATLRDDNHATWPGGKVFPQHTKLILVDDDAFFVGSRNIYPAWLEEHGFFIEDPTAARQLKEEFFDPQWRYSKADATYDWEKLLPPTLVSIHTAPTRSGSLVKVTVRAVTHSGDDFMVAYGNRIECKDITSGGSCAFNEDASIVGKKIDIVDEKTLRFTEGEVPPPSH